MNTRKYYTCKGSVRGWCGHRHRSVETAVICCVRDHRKCRGPRGSNRYSDRSVVYSDGTPLSESDIMKANQWYEYLASIICR